MDLKTFLLARIEEDEAEAVGLQQEMDYGLEAFGDRLVAECAAKRAIVEQAATYSPELEHGDNGEWAFDVTLRALAAVYADHPDYQPEWKL